MHGGSFKLVVKMLDFETVFGGREFHSLIVVGKKLFPNMFAECLICKN